MSECRSVFFYGFRINEEQQEALETALKEMNQTGIINLRLSVSQMNVIIQIF